MTSSNIRINVEQRSLFSSRFDGIDISYIDPQDISEFNATLIGPEGTPYAGGMYLLHVKYHDNTPFSPPKIEFLTKIFHPNITEEGTISLSILSSDWTPALTMNKTLLSIQSLLADPNPHDPVNAEAGKLYLEDYEQFESIAKQYRNMYCANIIE